MTNFIKFEFLVSCAMYTYDTQCITMRDLESYRVRLEEEFRNRNIDAMFLISNKYAEQMIYENPGVFELICDGTAVRRNDNISLDDIMEKYLAYMSNDDLWAVYELKAKIEKEQNMTRIEIELSNDEVEMLNGWIGQMSDGVGENSDWCRYYYPYIEFDNNGVLYNKTAARFKGKSDKDILKMLGKKFIKITEMGSMYCTEAELYFDFVPNAEHDKRDDIILGQKTANSIVEKFTGKKDYFEVDDEEELNTRLQEQQKEFDELHGKVMKGLDDLYNDLADLTGNEDLRDPEKRRMDPEEFYKRLEELKNG